MLSLCVGFSLIFEGMGSFLYHAAGGGISLFSTLDLYGIFVLCFAFFFVIVFYPLTAVFVKGPNVDRFSAIVCGGAWFAFCLFFWFEWNAFINKIGMDAAYLVLVGFIATMLIGLVSLLGFLLWFKIRFILSYGVLGLVSIVIGILAWVPEELNGKCIYLFGGNEFSWLQLHGIWHAGLALTIFFAYSMVRGIGMAEEVLMPKFNLTSLQFLLLKEINVNYKERGRGGKEEEVEEFGELAAGEEDNQLIEIEMVDAIL